MPRPSATNSGTSASRHNTRTTGPPDIGNRQKLIAAAAIVATMKHVVAAPELRGGISNRRTRKFLHGPHSVAPCIDTRQLGQNASPQSSHVADWAASGWLKQ